MSERPGAAEASRKARILRRTAVGSLLAGGVIALLVAASFSESGWVVLGTGLALSALSCLELARMGAIAQRGWGWVLAPCWLCAAGLGYHALDLELRTRGADALGRVAAHGYAPDLALEVLCVALLGLIGRSVVDGLATRRPIAVLAASVVAAWSAAWGWLFLAPGHPLATVCLDDSDLGPPGLAAAFFVAALVAWFGQLAWARERRRSMLHAAWIGPLLVLPLPWMWHVWEQFDHGGLVALIVLAKVGDIAGYYVGSAIGKRHPFPRISPGKTVAGCVGSLLAGMVVGGALVAAGLLPDGRLGVVGGVLAGGATNVAAQAGDLLESWLKRQAGVKDSGTWFGPSGGVLDLVDSLLLAVPAALLSWPWLLG